MPPALDLHAMAQQMKAAQDQVRQIEPFTSQLTGFDLSSAYAVAHLMHQARVAEGAVPVGRKEEGGSTPPARSGHRPFDWNVGVEGSPHRLRVG